MGKIELIYGDCMEYMKDCPDKSFDLAIVDPPYGIGAGNRVGADYRGQKQAGKYKTGDWDVSPKAEYWYELMRVSRNQVVFGANHFTEYLPVSRGWLFWDKSPIVPNYSDGELAWTSFDRVLKRKVIHWNGKARSGTEKTYISIHPTQKPLKLYDWVLSLSAEKGQRILDTHLGSGSSAIAAHYFGVDFVGIEIDEDYYNAAVERFNNETRQTDIFSTQAQEGETGSISDSDRLEDGQGSRQGEIL